MIAPQRLALGVLALLSVAATPVAPVPVAPAPAPAPVVIQHQDVPLITVFAWERSGNFINAQPGSGVEIPYDAARLQVKVYTFPTGEVRAIRFANGVRTHRHVNMTDTILYSWQAHRVQFVDSLAVVTSPGDFALHQKGVYHSGEEIRRSGGIDLEFALPYKSVHNDPTGFWSLAQDNPVQPAASWALPGKIIEAVGPAATSAAPPAAAHYRVRIARLPDYAAREVYLSLGTMLPLRDDRHDRLLFVTSGHIRLKSGGQVYVLESEDAARIERGSDARIEALDEAIFVEASVPPLPAK